MLQENLRLYRSRRGLSQEELANRLHVVRQTVSKWEKGTSVPDAELLIRLSEELDVSVGVLLGETPNAADAPGGAEGAAEDSAVIAERLADINEQLAERNRRARRLWTVAAVVLAALVLGNALLALLGIVNFAQLPDVSTFADGAVSVG